MPQYAVPNADAHDGDWLNQAGSATDIHAAAAPGTPGSIGAGDDTTYAESPLAPSNAPVVFALSDPEDPQSSSGHVMRWRRAKSAAGGATVGLVVELRQDYVNEAGQGTLINTVTDADISETFTTTTDTLSGAEADAITDYAALFVRIVANQT